MTIFYFILALFILAAAMYLVLKYEGTPGASKTIYSQKLF